MSQTTSHHQSRKQAIVRSFGKLYSRLIFSILNIPDESMSPEARERLEHAPELSIVELDGIFAAKPERSVQEYFETNRLPVMFKELLRGTLSGLYHCAVHPNRVEASDEDVNGLLNEGFYSRLIRIDPDGMAVVDMDYHGGLATFPGFYVH
ncbi:MAG: hypothetical protein JOZ39_10910, partial [Chloroflexi bacterium]|nr:hypothetical protein [Chloroflexota bacterium]